MIRPRNRRLLKTIMIVLGLYAMVWISLEGRLWQSIVLATGLVGSGTYLVRKRYFANRQYSLGARIAITGVLGMIDGFLIGLMTLILMVIKTGLHSHGPEFQQSEFIWVSDQILPWSFAGLLAGIGISLLVIGTRKN